jgi:predicted TIM-barrel fold metal-dependent hydrolase
MQAAPAREPVIEPDLPIIDPHHHLWFVPDPAALDPAVSPYFHVRRRTPRYLFDELLADLTCGHNVTHTVFIECGSMYRPVPPPELQSLGEIEFVNGVAAMAASGLFGPVKACAGIIGNVNLALGDRARPVLEAHMAAGGGRYRGVRHSTQHDPDPAFLGVGGANPAHQLLQPDFQAGFAHLAPLGLSFEAFVFEPQLNDVVELARRFPGTQIVLNHTGTPLGMGGYAGRRAERFPLWRQSMKTLADCANVTVKLGGLGMPVCGFDSFLADPPATSEALADEWRPYIESSIEIFGASRCMFESNFPTESGAADYLRLWNAFKRLAAQASASEKADLFAEVARRVYRLPD